MESQNERFRDIMGNMVKQWSAEHMFGSHLNDIENDVLNQVHDRYLSFKGSIKKAKNHLHEDMDIIYNNFINPGRTAF